MTSKKKPAKAAARTKRGKPASVEKTAKPERGAKVPAKGGKASSATSSKKPRPDASRSIVPGELILREEPIDILVGRPTFELVVANRGDRPIQVGSHYHFYETNRALEFERARAYGMRLAVAAGTAVRFEPGQKKTVTLVPLGGAREVWGFQGAVDGPLEGGPR